MINEFKDVLLLVLGWALGTLSPGIGRAIQRRERRAELLQGLRHECEQLRFTLANALFSTRRNLCEFTQATLDIVKPIIVGYSGNLAGDISLVSAANELFKESDENVIRWANDMGSQRRDQLNRPLGEWPVPYELPLLRASFGELDLLTVEQQRALFRVNYELGLFNEQVAYVRQLHDRTFTTAGANHTLNNSNLLAARGVFGNREAEFIGALSHALDTMK